MSETQKHSSPLSNLIIPVIVWVGLVIAFSNVKEIPYDFSPKDAVVMRYVAKFVLTILVPLIIIHLFYKRKHDFGIYFPKFSESFKLFIRSYAIMGPAGMTFLLIGALGWTFRDWAGAVTLSSAYLIVFYFVPRFTGGLPARDNIERVNHHCTWAALMSIATILTAYFTYEMVPLLSKILYYAFIVGLGEELFFRGYLQSAFNRFFGKDFKIGNVRIGWGLLISSLLFGLTHALVTTPPTWPWALFTFVFGLTLGFVREKDGSILGPALLHAMADMPLAFMT